MGVMADWLKINLWFMQVDGSTTRRGYRLSPSEPSIAFDADEELTLTNMSWQSYGSWEPSFALCLTRPDGYIIKK